MYCVCVSVCFLDHSLDVVYMQNESENLGSSQRHSRCHGRVLLAGRIEQKTKAGCLGRSPRGLPGVSEDDDGTTAPLTQLHAIVSNPRDMS